MSWIYIHSRVAMDASAPVSHKFCSHTKFCCKIKYGKLTLWLPRKENECAWRDEIASELRNSFQRASTFFVFDTIVDVLEIWVKRSNKSCCSFHRIRMWSWNLCHTSSFILSHSTSMLQEGIDLHSRLFSVINCQCGQSLGFFCQAIPSRPQMLGEKHGF